MKKKSGSVQTVNLGRLNSDQLLDLSETNQLSLSLAEMKTIQGYFLSQKRNPTDIELETIAQTWSEHCLHKTFRGIIQFEGKIIDNLLKQTIMKVTKEINKTWCISVFEDNAGVITFDKGMNVAFKVETHNHPSAIEPYGGANTGLGGVIRDILGVGLGAKPIMNTDVFCFASPSNPGGYTDLPKGVLHPLRILKGVVSGVRDYGNRMGIPTPNGAVSFDQGYLSNPLVFCGTVGIIPQSMSFKEPKKGDLIVVVGGKTGRDGIHGATFSSIGLKESTTSSVVQIGNAIEEKKVLDALLRARDQHLYSAVTDCGAGGLSSAVGEMGSILGAEVHLERVPLKYPGLAPWEIWVSEAQERMVLAVPKKSFEQLKDVFESENVAVTAIGHFSGSKHLLLYYNGNKIGNLAMEFLHEGCPRVTRKAYWLRPDVKESYFKEPGSLANILKKLLADYNIASKEWIIRQYDHEVQGGSVLKPLVGLENDGPGDASVIRPLFNSFKGIAVGCGINPKYGRLDPYAMAASCMDEAMRNVVAVGGDPDHTALLDNFCWGNPDKPEQLGGLTLAAQACYDVAKVWGTPFISGKDSLNNESPSGSIPPTLLISALAQVSDIRHVVSMDLKRPGNLIYIVGETKEELGGSCYLALLKESSIKVPQVTPVTSKKIFNAVHNVISKGLVASCHDCSEGGLAVAAAEMAFAGGWGMELLLDKVPTTGEMRTDSILFSESNSRFLMEIAPSSAKKLEKYFKGLPLSCIGKVQKPKVLLIKDKRKVVIKESIDALKKIWKQPLNF